MEEDDSIVVLDEFVPDIPEQAHPRQHPLDLSVGSSIGDPGEVEAAAREMIPSYADVVQKKAIFLLHNIF